MNILSFRSIVIICSLLVTGVAAANPTTGEIPPLNLDRDGGAIVSELEKQIPLLMEAGHVPGLQAALVRDGKIIWEKGFGIKKAGGPEPVTSSAIFEAASLTKPLFAYAALRLVDEGIIDLDEPIITYLPQNEIEALLGHSLDAEDFRRDWFERITARHVLSHSSGMPHGESAVPYPILFEPGTKNRYSAQGYYYLQKAVEHLKGEKLDDIIDRYVLQPLGMKHSSMVWRDEYEESMAHGHGAGGNPEEFRKYTEASAAASLYTTAGDYALFVRAVMAGEGLKDSTAAEMLAPQIEVEGGNNLTWSLGFGIQSDENGSAFWQWGDYGIFRNYIIAYPRPQTALVYLTNSFFGLGLCREIVERSLGGKAWGVEFLGYPPYDSPLYTFAWKVEGGGAEVVEALFSEMASHKEELLSVRGIETISYILQEGTRYAELIAFYEYVQKEIPGSAAIAAALARAYLESGEIKAARDFYQRALKAENRSDFDSTSVDWALSYIQALEEPAKPSPPYLKSLAGDYGPRHIKYEGGKIHYFRDNAGVTDYRELVPLTDDTFILRELIYFRVRFDIDEKGFPLAIIGLYENGYRDRSPRD
ncbi:MAG: beta-lactamase family protein [Candidatus Krumholzibacteriota bacterium]|nr:beta-lactamase family protein [Candidatus Krumholzibacteriota bacterium]